MILFVKVECNLQINFQINHKVGILLASIVIIFIPSLWIEYLLGQVLSVVFLLLFFALFGHLLFESKHTAVAQ